MPDCTECGERTIDGAAVCDLCGASVAPPRVERRGDEFIAYRGAALPPMCFRCGAPAEPGKVKQFFWHPPAVYLAILGGVLLYVIVAVVIRKRFDTVVPTCEAHIRRRKRLYWTGWGVLVGAAVIVVVAMNMKSESAGGIACGVGFVGFMASLVVFAVAGRTLRPTEITDEYGRFAGACPAFLATLE
jgi:hypothetical protein